MNKQIEALKMAIAEIEGWIDHAYGKTPEECANNKAIKACKEALAEAEQKEKQEDAFAELVKLNQEMGGYNMQPIKPLVTAPSFTISNTTTIPATWQSLSDDEVRKIRNKYAGLSWTEGFWRFYNDVEAKLKEKNYPCK